ncbi:hypothetical protein MNBD_GAMMA06-583 [hydrothermal vent metagenome]|uniref:NodB homology domain-containing protein n=1 Tax=hydrothermal vent metagenome TaxID=652676 RepID=A0A3B0WUG0_9ZZZZ
MKNLLKNFILTPLASRPVSLLASQFLNSHTPIFLVHQLVHDEDGYGITLHHLRKCLGYLVKNGHHFISLEDAISAIKNNTLLPKKSVVFTMDDGYMEQATIVAPIFLEFNCPITFFIISDVLDQKLWPWDAKVSWLISNSPKSQLTINFDDETLHLDISSTEKKHHARHRVRDYIKETSAEEVDYNLNKLALAAGISIPDTAPELYKAANWDIVRDLENKGVRFAPHSKTHRILSKMQATTARLEIEHSWKRLNEELHNPLNVFCYPTGRQFDFGPREIGILKENNFIGAVSTIPGFIRTNKKHHHKLYSLPRLALPDNMPDFIQYCSWIESIRGTP